MRITTLLIITDKSDKSVLHGDEHPNLSEIGSPKTKHCLQANQFKHKLNKNPTLQKKTKTK